MQYVLQIQEKKLKLRAEKNGNLCDKNSSWASNKMEIKF